MPEGGLGEGGGRHEGDHDAAGEVEFVGWVGGWGRGGEGRQEVSVVGEVLWRGHERRGE